MAHYKSSYRKTEFRAGHIVFIPELSYRGLPLPLGTATPFVVVETAVDGCNDELTELTVAYKTQNDVVKINVNAGLCYKPLPQAFCRRCGHPVCQEHTADDYPYYCPDCDEGMYGIEILLRAEM